MEWNELEKEISSLESVTGTCTPELSQFPAKISLAMSYVPYQMFENLYDENTAFERGTLFKGLDFPFVGAKPRKGMGK